MSASLPLSLLWCLLWSVGLAPAGGAALPGEGEATAAEVSARAVLTPDGAHTRFIEFFLFEPAEEEDTEERSSSRPRDAFAHAGAIPGLISARRLEARMAPYASRRPGADDRPDRLYLRFGDFRL
jgi:hypothetical protein